MQHALEISIGVLSFPFPADTVEDTFFEGRKNRGTLRYRKEFFLFYQEKKSMRANMKNKARKS